MLQSLRNLDSVHQADRPSRHLNERRIMKRWLRITVLVLLLLIVGAWAWRSYAARDRHYYGKHAEAAMLAGDWRAAAGNLQRLLEVDPENDEGRWFLSVVYQRMIQKEGQPLEEVPETPQSLQLLFELAERDPSARVDVRLLRHYVRIGDRARAIAILPDVFDDPRGRRDGTALASRLLATTTGDQESDQILDILEPNFSRVSLLFIRLKSSVLIRDGRRSLLSNHLSRALGSLASSNPAALQPLSEQNQQLLSAILQTALRNAANSDQADRRFVQSLQILKLYGLTENADQYRTQIAEMAVGLSATMEKTHPMPPLGRGGERTQQRMADDRKLRREAARRILEFGIPLVQSDEASPVVYEYVARAAMEVQDDSRQIAIFREGLRLYGDLPSDLRDEILAVHRDTALEMIAAGEAADANLNPLFNTNGTKSLGHLVAGFVAVEHGQLDAAQRHVARAKEDEAIAIPTALLQTRIHLAAARWQSGLDVLVPLEQRWDELTSTERVWLMKSQRGRDELRMLIAYCHVQLNQHAAAAPILAQLEAGPYRARARVLRLISLVRQGLWTEARALAAAAHQADSNNLALLLAEFAMRVREGRPDQASALLYRYTSLYPSDLRLRIVLARWLAVRGELAQSLALLEQTADQFPDDQVGPLMAAEMLLKLNREPELDSVLKSLNRPSTASAIVLLAAGNRLRKAGLDESADALFEAAPGLPSAQEFSLSTAVLSISKGHYRRAFDLLTVTLGTPKPLRRGRNGFLEKLEAQIRDVRPEHLAARIDGLLKTYPDEPTLLLASARLASRADDARTALSQLHKLSPLDPVPGRVNFLRAQVLMRAGKLDESRVVLDEVLTQVPQHAAARILAAELAWKQSDFQTTLQHLDLAGTASRATDELVFIRADSLLKLDRPSEAEPVFVELLQRDPKRPDAWLTLAGIQADGGRAAQTISTLEAGLSHFPKHGEMQERYLQLLGETRQLAKLESAVKQYSPIRPDLKRCLHMAEVYLEAGQLRQVQDWLLRARLVAPDSRSARLLFMEAVLLHDTGRRTGRHSWFVRAREKYTLLLERHPGHARGFNNLAWLLLRRFEAADEAGQFAMALLASVPATELSAELLDTLAESLRQSSRTKRAFELVEAGLERFPDSAALRFQNAALLFEMSGGDEAMAKLAHEHLVQARELGLPGHHLEELAELLEESP